MFLCVIKRKSCFYLFHVPYALFQNFYDSILKHKDKLKFELYPLSILREDWNNFLNLKRKNNAI